MNNCVLFGKTRRGGRQMFPSQSPSQSPSQFPSQFPSQSPPQHITNAMEWIKEKLVIKLHEIRAYFAAIVARLSDAIPPGTTVITQPIINGTNLLYNLCESGLYELIHSVYVLISWEIINGAAKLHGNDLAQYNQTSLADKKTQIPENARIDSKVRDEAWKIVLNCPFSVETFTYLFNKKPDIKKI